MNRPYNRPYKKPEARPYISCLCLRNVQVQLIGDRVLIKYPHSTRDTVIHIEARIMKRYEYSNKEITNEILKAAL